MDGFGCRSARKTVRSRQIKSRKRIAIIISNENIPSFGNLSPRDISSRAAKEVCDEGRGVGPGGRGVYLDFADAIKRLGEETIRERYGNLFEVYEKITGENAYKVPMRIYPAIHYTMGGLMGGLQFDEQRARFVRDRRSEFLRSRRQPPWRQRADAGLGRRLFHFSLHASRTIWPARWANARPQKIPNFRKAEADIRAKIDNLLKINGNRSLDSIHRELGLLLWDKCGMARNEKGLREALTKIPGIARGILEKCPSAGERMRISINRSNVPDGWPIFSSSPN